MLTEICEHLRNWFDQRDGKYINRIAGSFVIADGTFSPGLDPSIKNGQYIRIVGSIFNDGVHVLPVTGLTDESFDGAVFALAIPKELITLDSEISTYVTNNPASAFTSESFGGYSYSKGTAGASWQCAFAQRLNRWRKV